MTQKIVGGFPQYYALTHLVSKFYGDNTTQVNQDHTDIDLLNPPLGGDPITVTEVDINLLSVTRDGATLYVDQGFDIIAPNVLRLFPGLLNNETVEFRKLVGASGVIETIPSIPPTAGAGGYPQTIVEATVYTDNSIVAVNAFAPIVIVGKTRISTHFAINEGKLDVFINGSRVSVNDGIWSLVDSTTIELNDDYSAIKMKVDIVKQKVG
jgi:hypothetical protein